MDFVRSHLGKMLHLSEVTSYKIHILVMLFFLPIFVNFWLNQIHELKTPEYIYLVIVLFQQQK